MYGAIFTSSLSLTLLILLIPHYTQASLCSGITKESATPEHQIIRSPNYPNGYFNNELCRWEIQVKNPEYEVVRFTIQNTYIRNSATCSEDYVDIKDGATAWSRTLRKYCGENEYQQPVTSTYSGIFVTFKSNGKYTDKGFELEFWSVPKSIIEVQTVELKLVNYILFIVFGVILLSIGFGLVIIILIRIKIQKQQEKAKLEMENQRFAIRIENNGIQPTEKSKKEEEYMTKDPIDEKAKKRDSANNGSTTRVIKLEPTLGSGLLKETSTTPV